MPTPAAVTIAIPIGLVPILLNDLMVVVGVVLVIAEPGQARNRLR
jgi:hypothetical protein